MKPTTVDDLQRKWMKNSKYRREYEALEEEFSLAAALIEARARAGLTQQQVAQRMKTTKAVIARLEGSGSMPSTRTLEKYAKATGTRLKTVLSRKGRGPNIHFNEPRGDPPRRSEQFLNHEWQFVGTGSFITQRNDSFQ